MPEQLISPHGGALVDLVVTPRTGSGAERAVPQLALLGPDAPPALRPRAAGQRRLLASAGASSARRTTRLSATGCAWRTARSGRCRSTLDITEEKAAELGPGASLALRDPEGVMLAVAPCLRALPAGPRTRGQARVREHRQGPPRRVAYVLDKVNPVYVAGQLEMVTPPVHYDYKSLRLVPGAAAVPAFTSWVGEGRGLPDPQPDAPRPRRAHPAGGPPGRGQPPHPPLGRDDQAGRRGPPHPGALLPGRAEGLPARHAPLSLCCPWPCAWAGPERLFGTP